MTPFEISCPSCSKKLKVTRPELIGKKIGCPGCKSPVQIREPSSNGKSPATKSKAKAGAAAASDDPGAALAAMGDSGGSSYAAGIRKSKQSGFQPKHMFMVSGGIAAFVAVALVIHFAVDAQNQAALRDNLSDDQKKQLEAQEKIHGKGNVRLESVAPARKEPKTPTVPVKSEVRDDFQDFDFARSLHGKIQQLIRSHNRNPKFQQLRAEFSQLEQQYRYSKIEAPEFEEKCTSLLAKVNGIEREEVNKRLAVILELNSVQGAPADTLMNSFHDTVLPTTGPDWKIDSSAREKVRTAVLSVLDGTGLESNAELVARLVKFAEECY